MTHAEYTLPNGENFAEDFHNFTLDWRPDGLKTFVDNNLVLNVPFNDMFKKGRFPAWVDNLWAGSNSAPFDQEFYLVSLFVFEHLPHLAESAALVVGFNSVSYFLLLHRS